MHRIWDIAPRLAVLSGWLGLTTHIVGLVDPALLPLAARTFLVGLPSAMLVFAAVQMLARPGMEAETAAPRGRFAAGCEQAWPGMLTLALLPLAREFPSALGGHLPAAVILAAVLWIAWRHFEPSSPSGDPSPGASLPTWRWGLLALTASIGVLYFAIGDRPGGSGYFDGHYYFGVARHMALTGRFEEPIIWHFLSPPESIVHAPFDYWGGLTSVLLVPALWLFGASYHVALITMTAISALSLFAFWYLITVAFPIRHPLVQLIALLLFAFSPPVHGFRFDTESISVFHLFLVLALIAFSIRRYVWAVAMGFLLVLTRPDGLFLCLAIWCACVLGALVEPFVQQKRALWRIGACMAGLTLLFVAYHLSVFGTLAPPGTRVVPHLDSLGGLLAYVGERDTSVGNLLQILRSGDVVSNLRLVGEAFRSQDFVPSQDLWLVFAVLSCLAVRRAGSLLALGLLLVPFLSVQGSHAVFTYRSLLPLLPLLILAGGVFLDELFIRLGNWKPMSRFARAESLVAALVLFGLCHGFLADLRPYGALPALPPLEKLRLLDETLDGQPVATYDPYAVIAYTRSPAISIPVNGEDAIEKLLLRYGVRWLLIWESPFPESVYSDGPSDGLLREAYAGRRSQIGSLRLEFVSRLSGSRLFRLTRSQGDRPSR